MSAAGQLAVGHYLYGSSLYFQISNLKIEGKLFVTTPHVVGQLLVAKCPGTRSKSLILMVGKVQKES